MVHFTGSLKLIVSEAEDLRPTDFALRHQVKLHLNVFTSNCIEFMSLISVA